LNQGKLNAEANHNAHDQCHDEHLKEPEAFDRAIRVVEEKDDEDIHNTNGASSHKWDM